MLSTPKYQYKPLSGKGDIQLLELQPTDDISQKVQCKLHHTTLAKYKWETIEHYTAISYVWGDPTNVVPILVDDQELNITANLDSALRHIRDFTRTCMLWADAVCIDQANNEEKSIQVQQMAEVYETAQHTIIYLGESHTAEHEAVEDWLRFPNDMASPEKHQSASAEWIIQYKQLWSCLLFREWFRRVWVFQELLFSRDPWVQFGSSRVPWDHLVECLKDALLSSDLKSLQKDYAGLFLHMQHSRAEAIARRVINDPTTLANSIELFVSTLFKRRGLGVTDPRDMIFAHIGVLKGERKDLQCYPQFDLWRSLAVDYTQSTKEVYEELLDLCSNIH